MLHRAPEYFPSLAAADALISDLSSLIVEFGISGKPVCHLHNPNGPLARQVVDLDMDYVRQHSTNASTEAQLRGFLDRVAAGTEAPLEQRAEELRRRMGVGLDGATAGQRIKLALERRLEAAAPRHQGKPGRLRMTDPIKAA
jgi:CDP-glycerol glycerophosphotransferase (TagB/SpsB family)